jgi:hypothetical protein
VSTAAPGFSRTPCHPRSNGALMDRPLNHEIPPAEDAPAAAIVRQWYDLIDRGRIAEA